MKPGTRVRHIVTKDEGVVVEGTRMVEVTVCGECGLSATGTVLVQWDGDPDGPSEQQVEWIKPVP